MPPTELPQQRDLVEFGSIEADGRKREIDLTCFTVAEREIDECPGELQRID